MFRLSGKVALVTGTSSGIGLAVAQRFAAEGARVLAASRRDSDIPLVQGAPGEVVSFRADVSDPDDVGKMVAACHERFGRLDILCNNAGTGSPPGVRIHEVLLADWDRVLNTNLRGAFLTLRA